MHPWSWGRVRVWFWVWGVCWVGGLVVHPWRSVDWWTRNVLSEGDDVGNLCSEGVGVEDAMAPIMF